MDKVHESTPSHILENAREAFRSDAANPSPLMRTYRGLRKQEILLSNEKKYITEGYIDVLPKIHDKNFIGLVNEKIVQRKQTAERSGQPYEKVKIVDIGYGKGVFLLDCNTEWGEDVELIGIGSDEYTKMTSLVLDELGGEASSEFAPTNKLLKKSGTRLVNGSVVDIRKLLGDNSADFIVSCYALTYVKYPGWEMIKKIYRTLKPDGIALLDYDHSGAGDIRAVEDYLNNNGYDFETTTDGVAFQKTILDINVPIRTVNIHTYPKEIKVSESGKRTT